MKILAIDLGEKNTGLAVCDKDEILPYPLDTIVEKEQDILIKKIRDITIKNKIEMVVVGLPLNMDGSFGEKALNCKEFAKRLKNNIKIPVALWDERKTTALSYKYLTNCNTKKTKKKKIIDKVAATIILESFIEYKKNNIKINLV